MRNDEYGKSAIKTIFTIAILIAIITGIVLVAKKIWTSNSVKDIETDLLVIQAKCKVIYDKHLIDENNALLGEKIVEYSENEEVNKIVSQSEKWYKLGQEDLEKMGVGYLKESDGFLINYEESDVIYAKGIQDKDKIYYKLSEVNEPQDEILEEPQEENLEPQDVIEE